MDRFFRKLAGYGYLIVSLLAFAYIFVYAKFVFTAMAVIMIGSFIEYCVLVDDEDDEDVDE